MKQHIKKTAFVFAASLVLVACEKEQAEPTYRMNNESVVKSKSENINKSSDELLDDVLTFIEGVTESSLNSSYNAEEALLYTEAALNYRLTNDNHLPSATYIDTIEYVVEVDEEDDLIISEENIQTMNDDLYDEIYSNAENYNFEDNMDGKFISFVDIKWSMIGVGGNAVTVAYGINNFNSVVPNCNFMGSWRPIFDMGGCNGNPATSSDAGKELNRIVNYPSCNTELNSCQNGIWFGLHSTDEIRPLVTGNWSRMYTTNSIWNDISYQNVCLNSSRINQLRDSCIAIAAYEKPVNSLITLKTVSIGVDFTTSLPQSWYMHTYKYTYGQCLGTVPTKPEPCFNC